MTLLADAIVRSSLLLLAGVGAAALLRARSAALRHAVLACAICAAAAVVPLGAMLPSWTIARPADVAATPPAAAAVVTSVDVGPQVAVGAVRGVDPATVVLAIWAAGALFSAGVLAIGLARLRWLARRARPLDDPHAARIVHEVMGSFRLTRPVAVLTSTRSPLIATWGAWRPRIVLPAAAAEWPDERLRIVLHHELAHVRRHDWLLQMIADVVRCAYWFNPLIWTANRWLRRESERAADDLVLAAGVSGRDYAEHLVALARGSRISASPWIPALPAATPSSLERRIVAMLNPAQVRSAPRRAFVAALALATLSIVVPVAALRTEQSAPRPLTGSIYDTSGAVLPGVDVTLADANGGQRQVKTDSAGHFQIASVAPGGYTLSAELPGFRALRQDVQLRAARDWDRAVTLQVGTVQETISVTASRTTATAPAPGPTRVRVGGNVRAPQRTFNVNPIYPDSMRAAGREGTVPLEAIIARDGTVTSLRVVSAQVHPDFATAAMDAVQQWVFRPTLLNGVPVEVVMNVSVDFRLAE